MDKNSNKKIGLNLDNEDFYRQYGKKKTVSFHTLGCKVNQYETEAMMEIFENAGYEIVDFDEKADVYVINTCTVTGLSARKSRQIIRRAKSINKDAVVAVTGCYSQTAPEEVESIPEVDIIVGTKERSKIVEYVNQAKSSREKINTVDNIMNARTFEELKIDRYKGRTRAFLKIQEGCSQFCTYCIIPYARGPIRSRMPEDVLSEVRKLADNGFKEIVLTGIHIASYGRDIKNTSLLDLIQRINKVEGISRIRLGSIEPTTITNEFVSIVKDMEKLCPHYHISLQSGCDETLKRMNRKYTTDDFRKVVKLLRDNIKDVAITTDIMVGFPSETEDEFEQTFRFLEEISFAQMHTFKYSPRKGTPAASFTGQISADVKEERSNRVLKLSEENTISFNKRYIGRVMPVLYEQEVKSMPGYIEGLTANYLRVLCNSDDNIKGNILDTNMLNVKNDFIIGKLIE